MFKISETLAVGHECPLFLSPTFLSSRLARPIHKRRPIPDPQHRSLLLIHHLQVALDFAVVFRCRTSACIFLGYNGNSWHADEIESNLQGDQI